jgi:hypothetical protein
MAKIVLEVSEENQEELESMGKYMNPTEFKKRFVKR